MLFIIILHVNFGTFCCYTRQKVQNTYAERNSIYLAKHVTSNIISSTNFLQCYSLIVFHSFSMESTWTLVTHFSLSFQQVHLVTPNIKENRQLCITSLLHIMWRVNSWIQDIHKSKCVWFKDIAILNNLLLKHLCETNTNIKTSLNLASKAYFNFFLWDSLKPGTHLFITFPWS